MNPPTLRYEGFLKGAQELLYRMDVDAMLRGMLDDIRPGCPMAEEKLLRIAVGSAMDRLARLPRPAEFVRYCPSCGCVGEVSQEVVACCPEHHSARYVPEAIAKQARAGFVADNASEEA
jgi:hypothetical protein